MPGQETVQVQRSIITMPNNTPSTLGKLKTSVLKHDISCLGAQCSVEEGDNTVHTENQAGPEVIPLHRSSD